MKPVPRSLGALLLLILALAGGHAAASQPAILGPALPLAGLKGDSFSLHSEAVGRAFQIHIRLPEGYAADPGRRWPTVYATDGDALFPLLAVNHLFIHYDEKVPEAIIVGIAYGSFDPALNKRGVDFDPGKGAVAFQTFLKTELLPIVERRYRSDPARRILVGQSLGGAFVLYSAFSDPDLFWGRIASNPAMDPDAAWLREPVAARRADLGLIVVSGSRDRPGLRASALRWFAIWKDRSTPWKLTTLTLEGGTHAADATGAYRLGLRQLFDLAVPSSPAPR